MYMRHDPDEWETVSESRTCTACEGDTSKCNGACSGMFAWGQRRRAPEDVAKIKAAKLLAHEDAALAEAEAIKARRLAQNQ